MKCHFLTVLVVWKVGQIPAILDTLSRPQYLTYGHQILFEPSLCSTCQSVFMNKKCSDDVILNLKLFESAGLSHLPDNQYLET